LKFKILILKRSL